MCHIKIQERSWTWNTNHMNQLLINCCHCYKIHRACYNK